MEPAARRPIPSRSSGWARAVAAALVRWNVAPNLISASSVGWAVLTAAAMVWAVREPGPDGAAAAVAYVVAALAIGLRLLANLFDGMVAIEGGRGSKSGEVWNELPDRLSDSVVLVALGYAVGGIGVAGGWCAALLAVLTAYVRVLGVAAGAPADFRGPMAKQQRMAMLAVGLIGAAVEAVFGLPTWSLKVALGVIVIGTGLTVVRRTRAVVRALESR